MMYQWCVVIVFIFFNLYVFSMGESPNAVRRVKSDLDQFRDIPYAQLEQERNHYKTAFEQLKARYQTTLHTFQQKNDQVKQRIDAMAQEVEDKTNELSEAKKYNTNLAAQLEQASSFAGWCEHRITRYAGAMLLLVIGYKVLAMPRWKQYLKYCNKKRKASSRTH